jgi:hypothetical protein
MQISILHNLSYSICTILLQTSIALFFCHPPILKSTIVIVIEARPTLLLRSAYYQFDTFLMSTFFLFQTRALYMLRRNSHQPITRLLHFCILHIFKFSMEILCTHSSHSLPLYWWSSWDAVNYGFTIMMVMMTSKQLLL